jgi:prepilin-type N-terminal cleavage/methylation domain-containing protein
MRHKHGFSLVELSIVLVILGLLVGGILAGRSLIRSAELRAITSEYDKYYVGLQAFRDKYIALPGDMNNASKFWGAQDGGDGLGTDCTDVAATSQATCNGNGDWTLTGCSYEVYRAWQHLANAGLVEGTFTGMRGPGNACQVVGGKNAPRSRMGGAAWSIASGTWTSDGDDYAQSGTRFVVGIEHPTNVPINPAFRPEEAWNIDTKVDDGRPGLGKVVTFSTNVLPNCVTSSDPAVAIYKLDYTSGLACVLIFYTGTR